MSTILNLTLSLLLSTFLISCNESYRVNYGSIITPAENYNVMAGKITTIAGSAGSYGLVDDIGFNAKFDCAYGITINSSNEIFVADTYNDAIRKLDFNLNVTTIITLSHPTDLAINSDGIIFAVDAQNHVIHKVENGVASIYSGQTGVTGTTNGPVASALFNKPYGIAIDSQDNIYIAEDRNHVIRRITPAGNVSTFAGTIGTSGYLDQTGTSALFRNPIRIAIDKNDNLYVSDTGNSVIRKITPASVVTTLAGIALTNGDVDGPGNTATFDWPWGLAVDKNGIVYVSDAGNYLLRKISPNGTVETIAGLSGASGSTDGTGDQARLDWTEGVTISKNGVLYVTDCGQGTVRKIE